mmetsp:Transcript_19637/g.31998  ORF Transcript_19637/g.31998 Transcript_19637/m.31998 type:complete len:88 (-) Transcript_19637:439-702(-)
MNALPCSPALSATSSPPPIRVKLCNKKTTTAIITKSSCSPSCSKRVNHFELKRQNTAAAANFKDYSLEKLWSNKLTQPRMMMTCNGV